MPPKGPYVYRVHLYEESEGSHGYKYYLSREEASAALAAWRRDSPDDRIRARMDRALIPKTAAGLLNLLAAWAGHPDNG